MAKRVLTLIGARPQFVKAAVVSEQILARDDLTETIVHSGQHYDYEMSQVFFEEMGIPEPRHRLNVGSSSHARQTADMLIGLESIIESEQPDWLLVYGDTNTTLAGAITASKLHVPIAHVESGLRSFNRAMPEEINRIVTDSVSELLFTPTAQATRQLLREGHPEDRVINVGDVMLDAALRFADLARQSSALYESLSLERDPYILVTIHRAENTDNPERLNAIFSALAELAIESRVILPLHPRTRAALGRIDAGTIDLGRIEIIDPAGFLDMLCLEEGASLIVTDSGGVQKEAFFQRVPCVTVRTETEWTELVDLGWNRLADPGNSAEIVAAAQAALSSTPMDGAPYGAGNASKLIAEALAR